MNAFHILDDIGNALADLGADRQPFNKNLAGFFELVCFHYASRCLGVYGLGPGLYNKKFAGTNFNTVTIFGPFNIHGFAVMIFYNTGPFSQLKDFVVTDYVAAALFRGSLNGFYRFGSTRIIVVNHFYFLGTDPFADDGSFALLQRCLEDIVFVWVY